MMFAAPAEPYLLPDPVRLPAVPARELAPVLSADPDALALRSAAHELHWIAFATLHGPPPKGLEVFQVAVTTEQGDLDPAMIVSRPEAPSDVAAAWVEAFEAGLDTWSEAGFDSHVTHPAGEGAGVAVAPHDQAIHDA